MSKNFLNLTNGIEWISKLKDKSYSFIRIQSTWCEQKRWNEIIQDIDNNFLMSLAIGEAIIIYDCSSQKKVSRALFQGVEWIKFVCWVYWFNYIPNAIVKGFNVTDYFTEQLNLLSIPSKNKIKYFRKFVLVNNFNISIKCMKTTHDSDYEWYKNLLMEV